VTPPHTGTTFFTPTGPCLPWFCPDVLPFAVLAWLGYYFGLGLVAWWFVHLLYVVNTITL